MKDVSIILAVEDSLSEAVARKILNQCTTQFIVTNCLGHKGAGYLKQKINDFNKVAKTLPILILTDQDHGCPPEKIYRWLPQKANHNLIFRIAVMEIESWIMADRKAISSFLSVPLSKFPMNVDSIPNPKEYLISVARKSRLKKLVSDLVPKPGATAKIGPNYNGCLSDFIRSKWDIRNALPHSESLLRAFRKLDNFIPFQIS
jgi:hypothetical protein